MLINNGARAGNANLNPYDLPLRLPSFILEACQVKVTRLFGNEETRPGEGKGSTTSPRIYSRLQNGLDTFFSNEVSNVASQE